MTFKDYKKTDRFNLPFVKEIARITKSHESSVYRWLNSNSTPALIKQYIIADYLGKSVTELFPKNDND